VNIVMFTNTFTPHVGGVARSVSAFAEEYRRRGHRVLVVAPTFEGMPDDEPDVIRAPAIQNFNGSSFSVPLPMPGRLAPILADNPPDVVHSHHAFLLGDTALRVGAMYSAPVVFTHHTLYDQYTHYLGGESPALTRMAVDIATGYCNLCHGVIAPSHSIATMLRDRGVESPIEVIPTGVDVERFGQGDPNEFRRRYQVPPDAFLVGHVGRLAPEKNLSFLIDAVGQFLQQNPGAYFVVVGTGPLAAELQQRLDAQNLHDRIRLTGVLQGDELVSAYRAMDVFAFSSLSETQGMVLTEAMAADTPVVAIEGSGVADVLRDRKNGRLLPTEDVDGFAEALAWVAAQHGAARERLLAEARHTAEEFSLEHCCDKALEFYQRLRGGTLAAKPIEDSPWQAALRWIEQEWKILSHHATVMGNMVAESTTGGAPSP
jgi:glycosyltransferase involved in cell wall biosynthesis